MLPPALSSGNGHGPFARMTLPPALSSGNGHGPFAMMFPPALSSGNGQGPLAMMLPPALSSGNGHGPLATGPTARTAKKTNAITAASFWLFFMLLTNLQLT